MKEISSFLIHELTWNAKKKRTENIQTILFSTKKKTEDRASVPETEKNC